MSRLFIVAALCVTAVSVTHQASAEVTPNALFSDGAVLQRGMPVPVWGAAPDGEKVTVSFQGQTATTTASHGKWMVRLRPLKTGGPFTMTISGANTITIKDILVGEVWVCGGQSNMEFPLSMAEGAQQAIATSHDGSLRFFHVPLAWSDTPLTDVKGSWKSAEPDTVPNLSAVAYFFGQDMRKALGVPIGLIASSVGGTRSEWWTGRKALEENPMFKEKLAKDAKDPQGGLNHPSALYNAMIAPLQPFAMRGVIFYQGESNQPDSYQYRVAFPTLVEGWRHDWGEGNFPFLFVQVAPFKYVDPVGSWPVLRESQLLTSFHEPNMAMAVITDLGDPENIHPIRKKQVGDRLALAARALAYHQRIEYSGPIYKSMKVDGSSIVLSFTHVGGGLVAKDGPLTGFIIAGQDQKFYPATATIRGTDVVVQSPDVPQPVAVRFGWDDSPVVNFYNKAGLPASPFRTDIWLVITQPTGETEILPGELKGRTFWTLVPSRLLGRAEKLAIYLPPGYAQSTARYPVVYLLHGSPGVATDVLVSADGAKTADALISTGRIPPMIMVGFDASGPGGLRDPSWYLNKADGTFPMEDYTIHELVPYIDSSYRTIAKAPDRALLGISAGGYGALNLAIKHSDLFRIACSHSGLPSLWKGPETIRWFGRPGRRWDENSPMKQIALRPLAQTRLHIYMDVGDKDDLLASNVEFNAELDRLGVDHEFHIAHGGHEWRLWRQQLPLSLEFIAAHLPG